MKNREQFIILFIRYSIIDERRLVIDVLKKGFNYLKFLEKIKDVFLLEFFFVYFEEYFINKQYLKKLLFLVLEGFNVVNDKLKKVKEYVLWFVNEINGQFIKYF